MRLGATMKTSIWLVLGFILVPLVISGCEPMTPTPATAPTLTIPPRLEYTIAPFFPPLPDCSLSTLQAPTPLSPRGSAVIDSLTPVLVWEYSGLDCTPRNYSIEIYAPVEGYGTVTTSLVPGTATSFALIVPLKPGTAYIWRVRAANGTELSPLASAPGDLGSGLVLFFTGPLCDDAHLLAPVLVAPLEGATIKDLETLSLTWHYPGECLPVNYRPEIATDPAFKEVVANWTGSGPSIPIWSPLADLKDCRKYYWRAGSLMTDNSTLLFSAGRTFFVDLKGTCPLVPVSTSGPVPTHVLVPSWTPIPTLPSPTDIPLFNCSQYLDLNSCSSGPGANSCYWKPDPQNPNLSGTCENN
jgi:hypothetical protein